MGPHRLASCRRALAGAGALIGLIALAGCPARSHYQPLPADSTAVHRTDSLSAVMTEAQQRWDSGSGDDAARLTANALLAALGRRPPVEWSDRAHALLDSLGIGGETGSHGDVMVVNFFSRADPDHGSWPYLFWPADKGPRMMALEGRDLHFLDVTSVPKAQGGAVVVLFARRSAVGEQPLEMAWKPGPGGTFSLAQTLGPDSLGGSGSGEFAQVDSTLELHTRTFRPNRYFSECATCPHVYSVHRFHWTPAGFARIGDDAVPSPYSTFVRFIQALMANDRSAGLTELSDASLWDQARSLQWNQSRGSWRVAPSTDETAHEMTFLRGEHEAYKVRFDGRGGGWTIIGFESTTPEVE